MKVRRSKKGITVEPPRKDRETLVLPEGLPPPSEPPSNTSNNIRSENNGPSQSRPQMTPPEEFIDSTLRDTSKANDHVDQPTLENPHEITAELRKKFIFFLLVGSVVIFAPFIPAFYGLPAVGVMLAYYLSARSFASRASSREVFADSIYYMGFLFTFIALFATIGPLGGGEDLSSSDVIGKLGIALFTTVFGMCMRLVLTHFDQILTAPEEDIRDTLATMGAQLHDEIQKSITTIGDFRREAIKEMSGLDKKIATVVSEKLGHVMDDVTVQLAESVNRMGHASIQFQEKINSIDLSPEILRDSLKEAFSEVNNEVPKLAEAVAATAKEADKLRYEVGRVAGDMGKASDTLSQLVSDAEGLSKLSKAAVEGEQSLSSLNLSINEFKKSVQENQERSESAHAKQLQELSDVTGSVSKTIFATQEVLKETTREAEAMRSSMEGAVSDVVSFLRNENKR